MHTKQILITVAVILVTLLILANIKLKSGQTLFQKVTA